MRDPRLDALARVLVEYSCEVRRGDLCVIRAEPLAMPLVEAVYERILAAGGHPVWEVLSSQLDEIILERGDEAQLAYLSPLAMHAVETCDVRMVLWAERNTRALSAMPPERQAIRSAARKPYMQTFLQRESAGELRWVGTLYPTEASAQDAEMGLRAYEDFVFTAGLLDHADPVASWRAIAERQQRVTDWLDAKRELHFRSPARDGHDGIDLRVGVDGSTWINCAGGNNFPDGEVFAGPRGVEGHVNYNVPAVANGVEVEGIRLRFEGGRVVDASARKNEAFLVSMLDQDDGARGLGEIAIGTNYAIRRPTRNTLFDEKIGGTFHAACGAGYPASGSDNQSALHWDMVCDLRPDAGGGTIAADGEVFFRDGAFLPAGWPAP